MTFLIEARFRLRVMAMLLCWQVRVTKCKIHTSMAICWSVGYAFYVPSALPSSDIVDGVCLPWTVFPSNALSVFVGFGFFVVEYVVPLSVAVFCYSRMFSALHNKVDNTPIWIEPNRSFALFRSVLVAVVFSRGNAVPIVEMLSGRMGTEFPFLICSGVHGNGLKNFKDTKMDSCHKTQSSAYCASRLHCTTKQ